ncbi:MAG: hypothetical protein Kow00107_07090 [Planctomycetota bacterium]
MDFIPPWEALHPLVVHFPIALLTIAPLFVLLAVVFSKYTKPFLICAAILLGIGTLGSYVSVSTGEAAAHAKNLDIEEEARGALPAELGDMYNVFEFHKEMAGFAAHAHAVLFVLLLVLAFGSSYVKALRPKWLLVLWLVLSAGALVLLGLAGHAGARLVHEFGITGGM